MARSRFHRSLGYRAEQTGLLARDGKRAADVPADAHAAHDDRSGVDHRACRSRPITRWRASCRSRSSRSRSCSPAMPAAARLDERRWSRATLAVDAAAIAAGLGVQRALSPRANERLPRAGARTGGFLLAITGVGGMRHRRPAGGARSSERVAVGSSQFVVVPAAAGLAIGGEVFRRRRARAGRQHTGRRRRELSVAKSLAMSLAVVGVTTAISAGERKLADAIARAASRVLPGQRSAVASARPRRVARRDRPPARASRCERGFGMIETREESVEPSFDLPPPNSGLSGSLDSEVPFETLSKQGRRFVWNAQARRNDHARSWARTRST